MRFLVFLLLSGLSGLFLGRVRPPTSFPPSRDRGLSGPVPPVGTLLRGVTVVGRAGGKKVWEFKAEEVFRSMDGLIIKANGIKEGTLYEEGRTAWRFDAGHLRYEAFSRCLEIGGGVKGSTPAGEMVFRAPRVVGDLYRRRLVVEGPVEITGQDLSLRADRLEGDLAAETVVLKGHAEVRWAEGRVRGEEISYSIKDGSFTVLGAEEGVEIAL